MMGLRHQLGMMMVLLWGAGALGAWGQPAGAGDEADSDELALRLTLDQACMMTLVDGQLAVDTQLQGVRLVDQPVQVRGLPGIWRLTLRPRFYRFEHSRMEGPGALISVRIENIRNNIRIERSSPDGTVMYRQFPANSGWGVEEARLTIYGADGAFRKSLSARDFQTLLEEHRGDVIESLGTVFQTFQMAGIFSAKASVARHVLARERAAEEIERAVQRLIRQLNSDSFREREEALSGLLEISVHAAPLVRRMDLKRLTPQQRAGVEVFLEEVREGPTPEEVERLRRDVNYLIDCLYCEGEGLRRRALERLKRVTGNDDIFMDLAKDPIRQATAIEALRKRLRGEERAEAGVGQQE